MENLINNETVQLLLDEDDEINDGLLTVKIIAMIVLGISSFIVGILPLKLTKCINLKAENPHKNNLLMSLMLCFGGGVLLFTTFIHLQPEVRESFLKLEQHQKISTTISNNLPLAELVFCTGFFFVYLIEEIVHILLERKCQDQEDSVLQRSISLRRCSKPNNNEFHRNSISGPRSEEYQITCFNERTLNCHPSNIGTTNGSFKDTGNHVYSIANSKNHSHTMSDHPMKNSFHGLLAVLALSFHAIFEGLAVGLENNSMKVWYLFAAIATHKLVIAFCVGVELVTSKTKLPLFFLYLGTFAIVTPIGIGIGIALSESSSARHEGVAATVLQGMAAGTLLYVVFFEVLARERSNDHAGIWQLMAIIAGFVLMFVLQFATGHEHSHGHSHEEDETSHNHP